MAYQIDLIIEKDYLIGRVAGQQTLIDNEALVAEIVSACQKHDIHKVMLEMNQLVGQPGTLSDYQLATFAVAQGIPLVKKVALVSTAENYKFTSFFETAARNRGLNVLAFLDEEEALAWINED